MGHASRPCHAASATDGAHDEGPYINIYRCSRSDPLRVQTTHEDRDSAHLVMELCAGGELFDSIVESGNFTEKKAAQVFQKMVEVVHHCQELGVMHRDLKPEVRGMAPCDWHQVRLALMPVRTPHSCQVAETLLPVTVCHLAELPAHE